MALTADEKLMAEWFWVDRWMGSSAFLLPLEARGLYREMLSQAWRRGGKLPNDEDAIRRAVGATEKEWRRTWPAVRAYWRVDGDWLVNDTQAEIYAETLAQREAVRGRAKRAAERRWERSGDAQADAQAYAQAYAQASPQADAQADAQALLEQCPPSPDLVPTSEQLLERVPPQRSGRSGSLIARGEALRFDADEQRAHAKCHREVCRYWTTEPSVRVCLSSWQVKQFADKLVSVPEAERVPTVIRWAQQHVPIVPELPSNPMRYWDEQWDRRAASRSSSGIPSAEETRQRLAAIRARAGQ